ncbi:histidine kinase dimerization/phospho-acceptor domain-containing protein [Parasphingorhabdus sp. DH2-15]|uniref:histidine kinase dimerization/phospho-acceptor domain-containing protein n=1 Tax=Parasphingorhabdus sp. DH2-15 TaxID=3444112 RepID=UPI003F684C27
MLLFDTGKSPVLPYYDDRLSTVLAGPVPERALARVQYRQLLDLLSNIPGYDPKQAESKAEISFSPDQMIAGIMRLHQLSLQMTDQQKNDAIDELYKPIQSPALLNYLLSKSSTQRAALNKSQFSPEQWRSMRPLFGEKAQQFLESEKLLSASEAPLTDIIAEKAKKKSFVSGQSPSESPADLLILDMHNQAEQPEVLKASDTAGTLLGKESIAGKDRQKQQNIGDIVARIETFKKSKSQQDAFPNAMTQLPFHDLDNPDSLEQKQVFLTDQKGMIVVASHDKLTGINLFNNIEEAIWGCDAATCKRFAMRMAIKKGLTILPDSEGQVLQMTAHPQFDHNSDFVGYLGVISKGQNHSESDATDVVNESRSDHYRQLIHELRTPVGALKGFAEILESQLFGPVSQQYRQMAKTIVRDSDILLSHFHHLKYFEQDNASTAAPSATPVAEYVQSLYKVTEVMVPAIATEIEIYSGGKLLLGRETCEALTHWFEYFAAGYADHIIVTFQTGKDENNVRARFSGKVTATDGRIDKRNDEMRAFALLLGEARLLEAGIKIESDHHHTIMDLPVIPVMTTTV